MSDAVCVQCGGLKMEQGKCYGYAGKVCYCNATPYVIHPHYPPRTLDTSAKVDVEAVIYEGIRYHLGKDASGTAKNIAASIYSCFEKPRANNDHPDDLAVDKFASAMKAKMAISRAKGRGGWDDPDQCAVELLNELLHGHLAKGDPVDVGNFCMMIWNRGADLQATRSDAVELVRELQQASEQLADDFSEYYDDLGTSGECLHTVHAMRKTIIKAEQWLKKVGE